MLDATRREFIALIGGGWRLWHELLQFARR
jgi:hypothetical protein